MFFENEILFLQKKSDCRLIQSLRVKIIATVTRFFTGRFENFLAENFLFLKKTFYFWWKLFRFFENEIFGVLIKVASFNTFRITFLLRKIFRAEIYIPENFEKTF